MTDTVNITSGTFELMLHRSAVTVLTLGRLKKIIKIMLKASWENDEAVIVFEFWLREDVADAKGAAADVKAELDDYWHPGLVEDKKVRWLRRELKRANRDLERAQKLLDHFETERKKYYGHYDHH